MALVCRLHARRRKPNNVSVAKMTVAGQAAVGYNWDNANLLTGITQGSAGVGLSYDNANRRTCLTLPNGCKL